MCDWRELINMTELCVVVVGGEDLQKLFIKIFLSFTLLKCYAEMCYTGSLMSI